MLKLPRSAISGRVNDAVLEVNEAMMFGTVALLLFSAPAIHNELTVRRLRILTYPADPVFISIG